MVLEYAAGGELFDLIARRERVSQFHNHTIGYHLNLSEFLLSFLYS